MLAPTPLDRQVRYAVDPRRDTPSGRFAVIVGALSSRWLLLPAALPLWLVARRRRDARLGQFAAAGAISITASALVLAAVKPWADRPRPDEEANPDSRRDHQWPGRSFPSGHTGNVFALAAAAAETWRDRPAVGAAAFAAAATGAVSRIKVDRHWTTDVLAAAPLGILIGWAAARALRPNRCLKQRGT